MKPEPWPNGATAKPTHETPGRLIAWGYAIVSKRYCVAARIDRDDWYSVTTDEDHYRRMHSRDLVVVPPAYLKKLPNSIHLTTGYRVPARCGYCGSLYVKGLQESEHGFFGKCGCLINGKAQL